MMSQMLSRALAALMIVVLANGFLACGPGGKIGLVSDRGPGKSTPIGNDKPGDSAQPGPVTQHLKSRLFCLYQDRGESLISTTASDAGAASSLQVLRIEDSSSANQVLEIRSLKSLIGLGTSNGSSAALIASGEGVSSSGTRQPRAFYSIDLDLGARVGVARLIANGLDPASAVVALANSFGLEPRNHGVSQNGNYVLLPVAGALLILEKSSWRELGRIALETSLEILPSFDESTGLLKLLWFSNGRFLNRVWRLLIQDGVLKNVSEEKVGLPTDGFTVVASNFVGSHEIWSLERSMAKPDQIVALNGWNLDLNQNVKRLEYLADLNEKFTAAAALVKIGQDLKVFVGVESVRVDVSGPVRYRIDRAEILRLAVGKNGLEIEKRFTYPDTALEFMTNHGTDGFALKAIASSENVGGVYVTLPPYLENSVFRIEDTGLEANGLGRCAAPAVMKEVDEL